MRTFKYIKMFAGLGLIILGIYLIILAFLPINTAKYKKPDSDLLLLTAYLTNTPIYYQNPGVKTSGKSALRLELDGYPGIYFDNENEFLEAADYSSFLKDAKYHDTVTIKVLKKEFEKYYTNRNNRSAPVQFFDSKETFSFYSLRFRDKEYITSISQAAERKRKENLTSNLLIGLFIAGIGSFLILTKK